MSVAQQQYHGATNLKFGLGATAVTVTGLIGIYQAIDHDYTTEQLYQKDQRNSNIARVDSNPREMANFEMTVSDANTPNAGNAVIAVAWPGTMVTVGADSSDPINGSTWIIDTFPVKEVFNGFATVSFKASRDPLILV